MRAATLRCGLNDVHPNNALKTFDKRIARRAALELISLVRCPG